MTTIIVTVHTTNGQKWSSPAAEGVREAVVENIEETFRGGLRFLTVETDGTTTLVIPAAAVSAVEIKQVGS